MTNPFILAISVLLVCSGLPILLMSCDKNRTSLCCGTVIYQGQVANFTDTSVKFQLSNGNTCTWTTDDPQSKYPNTTLYNIYWANNGKGCGLNPILPGGFAGGLVMLFLSVLFACCSEDRRKTQKQEAPPAYSES